MVAAVRLVTNHGVLGDVVTSPRRSDRGAGRNGPRTTVRSTPVQQQGVAHDADAAPYVVEGVAGERSPGGGRGEIADAGPGVQRDCAIAQFGDDVVERRSERGDGTRVRDEVDTERAGELLVRGTDRRVEELPGVAGQFEDSEDR